jgi:hypothetical protein
MSTRIRISPLKKYIPPNSVIQKHNKPYIAGNYYLQCQALQPRNRQMNGLLIVVAQTI